MTNISFATTAVVAGLALSSLASADTIVFDSPLGDLGATHTYTLGGASIVATAFNGGDLFGKNLGFGEQGLGLTADPNKENEIFGPGTDFIQLDLLNLINFTGLTFRMNSVQTAFHDSWSVSACSVSGTDCGTSPTTGTDSSFHGLPAGFSATNHFLDFSAPTGNVLLSALTGTAPTVPEPRFYGIFVISILGLSGFVYRKARRARA